ncbi:MAG: hypothetical protein ABJN36_11110, partial [Cyclobacteriaceae bacterium]
MRTITEILQRAGHIFFIALPGQHRSFFYRMYVATSVITLLFATIAILTYNIVAVTHFFPLILMYRGYNPIETRTKIHKFQTVFCMLEKGFLSQACSAAFCRASQDRK